MTRRPRNALLTLVVALAATFAITGCGGSSGSSSSKPTTSSNPTTTPTTGKPKHPSEPKY